MKGNRPDFHDALEGSEAKKMYLNIVDMFISALGSEKVHCGIFGAYMMVSLVNDGPVTIELDSRKFSYDPEEQYARIGGKKGKAKVKAAMLLRERSVSLSGIYVREQIY
ncbi:D-aminoacyl-tRNA deacylase DTD like protein [Aduncisulcus paluster]|uniref:D-aminoacyl-tRNA deacylase n=1 Tax=Aduncisulcus paluster TaxID=2918883 RepID=A0ABQ5KLF8_9EUKA|nr:D-aminoacyl-tRNA deacylase DTD like protein [Aduncisulcus paluster]